MFVNPLEKADQEACNCQEDYACQVDLNDGEVTVKRVVEGRKGTTSDE